MKYAIDGSNVLLGLRLNRKPSARLFARLLHALRERGTDFELFFDNSIQRHMTREGLGTEWNNLLSALKVAGIRPTFAPRADTLIGAFCHTQGAWLINSTDKIDSWNENEKPAQIHRARVRRNRNTLQLVLINATGRFVFSTSANDSFEFGGIAFPALSAQHTMLDPLIAPDTQYASVATQGTLLVLALDASGSMSERNSYDGRPKTEHLNEVVKSAIKRLHNSRIREGLYIAILRFENDVTPLFCSTGAMFSHVNDWFKTLNTFDYLRGVTLGQTNIRLALQRSKELFQDTLSDSDSVSAVADEWRAALVLITDGNHYVEREDGTYETDDNVAIQAVNIHEGLSGLSDRRMTDGRIDVGCVGIGTDVNRNLLVNIASQCTPKQRGMATRAGIGNLLVEDRLCILVDSNSDKFGDAIRTFIDVASGSA